MKYIQFGKCFVGKLLLDGNTLWIKLYLVNAQIIPSWIWLLVFCNIIHMVSISFGNCRFSKCILVLILGLLSWIRRQYMLGLRENLLHHFFRTHCKTYSFLNFFLNKLGARTLGARSGGRSSNNLDMDKSFNSNFATRMAVAPFSNI